MRPLLPAGAAGQLPLPRQIASPGRLAEHEVAGDARSGHPSWPGLPSVNSTVCASQGWPGLPGARPGQAGPPSCCGSRRFWGWKTNQPCVLQAAKLLRNVCLGPGAGTPFSGRPLAAVRDRYQLPPPLPRPASRLALMGEEVLGLVSCPICSCHPFTHPPIPQPSSRCWVRRAWGSPQAGLLALEGYSPGALAALRELLGHSGAPLHGWGWQRDRTKAPRLKSFLLRWECLIRSGPPPGGASHSQEGLLRAGGSLKKKWGGGVFMWRSAPPVSILESLASWPKLCALESVPLNISAECLLCTKQKTSQRVSA